MSLHKTEYLTYNIEKERKSSDNPRINYNPFSLMIQFCFFIAKFLPFKTTAPQIPISFNTEQKQHKSGAGKSYPSTEQ
jgi:hypothetical protein